MTWVTDHTGTHWIEYPARKRRAPRTGGRFSEIAVGDHLVQEYVATGPGLRSGKTYSLVTDLWFDPVAGEKNPWHGQMVAVALIKSDGSLADKARYSRYALASQRFQKTDVDYLGICRDRMEAAKTGAVVGIGMGHVIRRRPKTSGGL